jgi:hypothetical protein
MAQPTFDHVDFMYTALVADGSQIPPVIFTSDPNLPAGVEGREDAFIIHIPNLSSNPSADTTLRWIDAIQDYISDDPHLIHDSGKEFTARASQEKLEELGVSTHKVPASGGAFLNPCDNNFHHDMKHHYYSNKQRTTHADMLKAMIDSYFAVKESNIKHYFQHTRITGLPMTNGHIQRLLGEGYHPGKGHEDVHEKCIGAYKAWKKNLRQINEGVRSNSTDVDIDDTHLDGVYWQPHSRK